MNEKDAALLGKNWISQTLVRIAKENDTTIEACTWQTSQKRQENMHCLIVSGHGKCAMKQFSAKDLVACISSDKGRSSMEVRLLNIVRFFSQSR